MLRISIVLVVAACGSSHDPTPSPADGDSIFGWWQLPDNEGTADFPGATLRLTADETVFVQRDHQIVVRDCTTVTSGKVAQVTGCGPITDLVLDGDRLHFPLFTATRIDARRATELDAIVAAGRPPPGICKRARACYRAAMAALGTPGDEATEFRVARGPSDCQKSIELLVAQLGTQQLPIPAACR